MDIYRISHHDHTSYVTSQILFDAGTRTAILSSGITSAVKRDESMTVWATRPTVDQREISVLNHWEKFV